MARTTIQNVIAGVSKDDIAVDASTIDQIISAKAVQRGRIVRAVDVVVTGNYQPRDRGRIARCEVAESDMLAVFSDLVLRDAPARHADCTDHISGIGYPSGIGEPASRYM